MVGGGRLVQEFGGRRRRLGGGFRLGVGVKSLVGSASAWSVKGGFLLLPATRERKKKVLTLLRNWRTKETVVNNICFLLSISSVLVLDFCFDFHPLASVYLLITPFFHFCARVVGMRVHTYCNTASLRCGLGLIIVWRSRLEGHGGTFATIRSRGVSRWAEGSFLLFLQAFAGLGWGMGATRTQRCCHRLWR